MRIEKWLVVISIVVLALTLFLKFFLIFNSTIGFDEGAEGYISKEIFNGKTPYLDIFDHKTPLTHYPLMILFPFFGISGISIKLLAFIYEVIMIFLIFIISKKLLKDPYSFIPPAIYSVFMITSLTQEVPMSIFGLAGFFFYIKWMKNLSQKNLFISGILIGLSCWFKQPGILFFIAVILHQFYMGYVLKENRNILKDILIFISGVLIISLPLLIYFITISGFTSFFDSIILFNLKFAGSTSKIMTIGKFFLLIISMFGLLLPLIIYFPKKTRKINSLFIIYFLTLFFFFLMNREIFSQHLFQAIPFIAIFAIISLKFSESSEVKKIFGILIILFFISSILIFSNDFVRNRNQTSIQKDAISKINEIIPQGTQVFADNPIYLFLGNYSTDYKIFLLAPSVASVFDFSDFPDYASKTDYLIFTSRKKYLGDENLRYIQENFQIIAEIESSGEDPVEIWERDIQHENIYK